MTKLVKYTPIPDTERYSDRLQLAMMIDTINDGLKIILNCRDDMFSDAGLAHTDRMKYKIVRLTLDIIECEEAQTMGVVKCTA